MKARNIGLVLIAIIVMAMSLVGCQKYTDEQVRATAQAVAATAVASAPTVVVTIEVEKEVVVEKEVEVEKIVEETVVVEKVVKETVIVEKEAGGAEATPTPTQTPIPGVVTPPADETPQVASGKPITGTAELDVTGIMTSTVCHADKQGTWSPSPADRVLSYEIEVTIINAQDFGHLDFYRQGQPSVSVFFSSDEVWALTDNKLKVIGLGSYWIFSGCDRAWVEAEVQRYAKERHDNGNGHSGLVLTLDQFLDWYESGQLPAVAASFTPLAPVTDTPPAPTATGQAAATGTPAPTATRPATAAPAASCGAVRVGDAETMATIGNANLAYTVEAWTGLPSGTDGYVVVPVGESIPTGALKGALWAYPTTECALEDIRSKGRPFWVVNAGQLTAGQ